jgi:cytochrome c556
MSDYDKAVARYVDDAKQAKAQVSDLDSFKMLFPKVVRNCAACHESYRAKSR